MRELRRILELGKRCLRESIARSSSPEGVVILNSEIDVSLFSLSLEVIKYNCGGGDTYTWYIQCPVLLFLIRNVWSVGLAIGV